MGPAQLAVQVLRFVSGKYEGRDFPLDETRSFIAGRSGEADLVLADDAVSRKHARFYPSRGRVWVRDLGSRNGTAINGEPVTHHCLREGDRVAIGSSLAKFVSLEQAALSKERAGERGDSNGESGRSMTGSIEDIPLMDVLQWLATSRKTGVLNVREPSGGRVGSLHLRDGVVFFAQISGGSSLHPEKAMMRMLGWARGNFELDSTKEVEESDVQIQMSLEHMLMEAARIEDELSNLARKGKIPTSSDRVVLASPSPVRWHELEEGELGLVQDIIELGSWQEVADTSEVDDLSLTRLLVGLHKKGVVTY